MAITRSLLIVGGSGFLGTHLALRLRDSFKVFATYNRHRVAIPGVTCMPLNVDNRNWVKRVVYTAAPDVVVYAAGSEELAEEARETREAERVHTSGPTTVSNVTGFFQTKVIFLSSCHVFDGERGYYKETDIPLAAGTLGKAKLAGENGIRGKSLNYLIVRSSPVFGRGNGYNLSLLDRLRMRLDRGERVELPTDELHSFAPVDGFVDLVARLAETPVRNRILHYGGLTKLSYYEWGKAVAERFGYDAKLVHPSPTRARKGSIAAGLGAEAALDFSLNSTAAAELLKIQPLALDEGLDLVQKKLVSGL
jgi:dTDP-4-dehydrorhamnose reductase